MTIAMGPMIRQFCAILLLLALTVFGGTSHAAMQDQHAMCGQEHAMADHCNGRNPAMHTACVIACLGSILQTGHQAQAAPIVLLSLVYPLVPSQLRKARVQETAERPPKFI